MVEIKDVYSNTYQSSLADDIHKYCVEEDLKNILLSFIKGITDKSKIYIALPMRMYVVHGRESP